MEKCEETGGIIWLQEAIPHKTNSNHKSETFAQNSATI